MDPSIVAAGMGFVGGLLGAVLGGYFQRSMARDQIAAAFQQLRIQIAEKAQGKIGARNDILLDGLSELLALTNPMLAQVKLDRVLAVIGRCELVLNPFRASHAAIRSALMRLLDSVTALARLDPQFEARMKALAEREVEVSAVHEAHSHILDAWRHYLAASEEEWDRWIEGDPDGGSENQERSRSQ